MLNKIRTIDTSVVQVGDISLAARKRMFALFEQYYSSVSFSSFNKDLEDKDSALLLCHSDDIIGFTTLKVMDFDLQGSTGRALFSGDTIIRHDHWGNQALAKAWCEYAGKVKAQSPELALYWFLIVKGHKTYRYLPVFTRRFYPNYKTATPEAIQQIMDHLGSRRFGDAYKTERGLVEFASSQGHLRSEWADIPDRLARNPHVDFFLGRNPGYGMGHELVCVAELSEENMRFHARQAFLSGRRAVATRQPTNSAGASA